MPSSRRLRLRETCGESPLHVNLSVLGPSAFETLGVGGETALAFRILVLLGNALLFIHCLSLTPWLASNLCIRFLFLVFPPSRISLARYYPLLDGRASVASFAGTHFWFPTLFIDDTKTILGGCWRGELGR